jgi:hypothetical protein
VSRARTAGLRWSHPFAPAPVLAVLAALTVGGLAAESSSWQLPVLVAWVVLALSAGYSISGSV